MTALGAQSKLFHTIVVVGLSIASTACGSTGRMAAGSDGAAPPPDGSPEGTGPGDTRDDAQGITHSEAGFLAPENVADASDSSDAGQRGDACMQLCCPQGCCALGEGSSVPCGTCPWPCYV